MVSQYEHSNLLSQLELVLVMNYKFSNWWYVALKPSFELFWPKKFQKLKVITESTEMLPENDNFIRETSNLPYAKIAFEILSGFEGLKQGWGGHKKQQYDMFNADRYSNSEYIGFIDTDAVFLTPVDESIRSDSS